ncbi:MAG: hypothetical protein EXS14_09920 [Planctomycetes bacterium]|nr:hypothetical protein [Planctomycetota bacterium]
MARGAVLLAVSASVAIHRALDIASELRKRGTPLRVMMTRAATKLITPVQFQAVSGAPVFHDLFAPGGGDAYEHLTVAREASVFVAAPATADFIARLAAGIADDAPTTAALAFRGQYIFCPAMNWRMWEHPFTQRNVGILEAAGWRRVGPDSGELGCGEEGTGRLAAVEKIVAGIQDALMKVS